jgi:uncharacterized membrane protein (DUF2068 family)
MIAKRRPLVLSVLILLLGLSTLNALRILLTQRTFFVSHFPGASNAICTGYIVAALVILVGLVGLWQLKRWSVWVLAVATIATLGLDQLADAPATHKIATVSSMLMIIFFSKPVWPQLSR